MDERDVRRIVRAAAESVYGVVAVVGTRWFDRLFKRLNLGVSGIRVATDPRLAVSVDLRIADGVPARQVAANVAERVRYVVQRDVGAHIDDLTVRVNGRPITLESKAQ